MSFTMTRTATESFTLTHAKYLASKVTADLKRCQQRYGKPSDGDINDYGTELALLLRDGFVSTYEFGFKRNDQRVVSWNYTVDASGNMTSDDRPGGIYTGAEITGATWFNFLNYTAAWRSLDFTQRQRIEADLPIQRTPGTAPADGLGYWVTDRTYSSTGVAMSRKTFRGY